MRFGRVVWGCGLISLAPACGAPPLDEGTYELETSRVVSDTCGLSDEEYGVGDSELVKVHWDGDVLVLTGAGDAEGSYTWDGGEEFEAAASDVLEIDDTNCAVRVDREVRGHIRDRTSFELEVEAQLSTEGDCSDVDTTGLPCSAVILHVGELVE